MSSNNSQGTSDSAEAASAMLTIRNAAPHLLRRLQEGVSKFELVYTPHSRWPLPPPHLEQSATTNPVKVSILDSSFNPPTLAHLSLANSRLSQPFNTQSNASGETSIPQDYAARLLLLSVKNADKTLEPGDATYSQRLEMMSLLARSMNSLSETEPPPTSESAKSLSPEEAANAAIGIIDEPTFVGKSSVILANLRHSYPTLLPSSTTPIDIELTFLVGLDTLERLFSPRYYPSEEAMMLALRAFLSPPPEGENSRVVCAHRVAPSAGKDEKALSLAKEFIDTGRIVMIDMGDEISKFSSTTVRRSIGSTGQDDGSAGSWRRLVTKDVADYIVKNQLYQPGL